MEEEGINLDGHYAKSLSDYMHKVQFGYLITVCSQAEEQCPSSFPGMGQRLHWNLEDPAAFTGSDEKKIAKFREIRDQIQGLVRDWIKQNKP
jgi:arsenate reductase